MLLFAAVNEPGQVTALNLGMLKATSNLNRDENATDDERHVCKLWTKCPLNYVHCTEVAEGRGAGKWR